MTYLVLICRHVEYGIYDKNNILLTWNDLVMPRKTDTSIHYKINFTPPYRHT